ncbi:hypothetical protein [Allopontixanthobacter sediminis]|uniref:DNA recombination protein RmuC n=1 Tax=Allopontixanthobacter sediminis TaxID=1689985 RepID=A0A845AYD5_9SPHN|nr:hypothetical protein [Allopontixanthobacter sediminis]MXP42958.1 hypothetical protein [Allopontixanthobacter sediminis]
MLLDMLLSLFVAAVLGGLIVWLIDRQRIRNLSQINQALQDNLAKEIAQVDHLTDKVRSMLSAERDRKEAVRAGAARATEARKASAAARRLLKSHQ